MSTIHNGVTTYCLYVDFAHWQRNCFPEAFARVDAVHGQLQFFFLQRNTSLKYECMRCYPQVNTVYLQLEGCRNTINFDNTKKSGDLILYNMHVFRTSPTLHYPPQQTMSKRHPRTCSMNVAFGKMWLLTLWSCHDDFLPIHQPCVGLAPDRFDQLWLTLQPPGNT